MEQQSSTQIQEACRLIRLWDEFFREGHDPAASPEGLVNAVAIVKRYLESDRADGKPIHELRVAEHLLTTREGVRWVMPFVLAAESKEASKRPTAIG